jgi:ABC-type uncharacterized transport system permease subunit
VAGFALLLLLGLVMAWLGFLIGVLVKDPEAINSIAALVTLPVTFLSNAFIPLGGLPGWLRIVCEWNPFSSVVSACRELFGNPTGATASAGWPAEHAVLAAVVLFLVGLAALVPASVRAYRRAVSK